jgi:predicted aminopeptidase
MRLRLLFISVFSGLMSCSHLSYYAQAVHGHWQIVRQTQPITQILHESNDIALKQQLATVLKIKTFATEELHLPKNASYTEYADLKRPYVVWSVFATPSFSLELKRWCFLFAGCISYRGYFNEASARELAETLQQQGYDVYVAGITAYSTLGWFNDPVLNTMLDWPTPQLAGLIFHELAHQQLYLKDDSIFNESFASIVEQVGTERWLAQQGTPQEIAEDRQTQQQEQAFVHLIMTTRQELEKIYQQPLAPESMTVAKQQVFDQLQTRYAQLKQQWNNDNRYDRWFATQLNNAKLASVITYQHHVPAFQALLARCHNDLPKFYLAAKQLGELPPDDREYQLNLLAHEKQSTDGQQNCRF